MSYEPLYRAIPEPRGCGDRTPGGLYIESGLGPGGVPLEHFLVDPPLPVPEGLDLVNKPQIVVDTETGVTHVWLWIGAEWYPYCPDFIAETRRLGASRKLNPQMDLSQLTPGSRMILVHPAARNTHWREQQPPHECAKRVPGHALEREVQPRTPVMPPSTPTLAPNSPLDEESPVPIPMPLGWRLPEPHLGPCLFKTFELIPQEASADASQPTEIAGRRWYARRIGSTTYFYEPSGESVEGLESGVFAALPITGFALIRHPDGSVNEPVRQKLEGADLPYYTSDR